MDSLGSCSRDISLAFKGNPKPFRASQLGRLPQPCNVKGRGSCLRFPRPQRWVYKGLKGYMAGNGDPDSGLVVQTIDSGKRAEVCILYYTATNVGSYESEREDG